MLHTYTGELIAPLNSRIISLCLYLNRRRCFPTRLDYMYPLSSLAAFIFFYFYLFIFYFFFYNYYFLGLYCLVSYFCVWKYSRLSLSRSPRDSLKYFEISLPRHIRFVELRKNKSIKHSTNEMKCKMTLEVRDTSKSKKFSRTGA